MPPWLDWVSLGCSVFGLILTVITMCSVLNLRNQYIIKALGPKIIRDLQTGYKSITGFVGPAALLDALMIPKANEEIKKCEISLRWLKGRSDGELLRAVNATLAKCKLAKKKNIHLSSSDMAAVSTELACVFQAYKLNSAHAEWQKGT